MLYIIQRVNGWECSPSVVNLVRSSKYDGGHFTTHTIGFGDLHLGGSKSVNNLYAYFTFAPNRQYQNP